MDYPFNMYNLNNMTSTYTPKLDFTPNWNDLAVSGWNNVPDWNNVPAWGNYTPSSVWGGSSIYNGGSSKTESYEDASIRMKKTVEQKEQIEQEKIKQQEALEEIDKEIDKVDKGKQADGSCKVEDTRDLKNVSFVEKATKVGLGLLSGTINVAKGLLGFDKDGKWNWKKCLKNAAIAVGVGALCVCAGPLGAAAASALGGSAFATAVGTAIAATPTVLGYAGLASGTYAAAKGAYGLYKADTVQELENSAQDLGSGLTIAVASKAGLKKMSAAGGFTKADGGLLGWKNVFVNPFKAAKADMSTASTIMSRTGGGWKGFAASCKHAKKTTFNRPAENAKKNFEQEYQNGVSSLQAKIQDLEQKINTLTGTEKQLAEAQHKVLMDNYLKLTNASTKADWKAVLANKPKEGFIRRHWGMSADEKAQYEAVTKAVNEYNKVASELKSLRFKSMRAMSGKKQFQTETQSFGLNSGGLLGNISNYAQCTYMGYKIPTSIWGWSGKALNLGFLAMDPSWAIVGPSQGLASTSLGYVNNINQSFNPIREAGGQIISADEVKAMTAELASKKAQLEQSLNALNQQSQGLNLA